MKNYFYNYIKRYDSEIEQSLKKDFELIWCEEFLECINKYSENINFNYRDCLEKVDKLGEKVGVNGYSAKFIYCLCLTQKMKEYYLKQGYSEEFFEDNVKDFDYKLEECRLVKGVCGCFCTDWFGGHFNLTRFKLGRLQFEIRRFPDFIPEITEYKKGEISLNCSSPLINVHIPRSGERLDEKMVEDSFARASEFYKKEFQDSPVVFCCASWLLYPRNAELMKEGSNLRKFFDLFDVVYSKDYDGYVDCWRLFDMDYTGNPDDLPEDSSLRREYKALMKRGEKTGWGFGIHIYKN